MGSNLEIVWSFTNIKFEIVQTNTICYYESVDKQKLKMKDELGKQWYQSFFHTMVPKCTWKLCNYFVLLNNKWRFLKIPIINCVCFFSLVHFYFQDIKTLLVSVNSQNHLLKNMYYEEFILEKENVHIGMCNGVLNWVLVFGSSIFSMIFSKFSITYFGYPKLPIT